MSLKQQVLQQLEACRGRSVSGEELARSLSVSRTAVWKAVQSLKADGYAIGAATNRGYRLDAVPDRISVESVLEAAGDPPPSRVLVYSALSSTNSEAKRMAVEGAPHGTLLLAEEQTQGRGRLGRSFHSPKGGIYMSLILRPRLDLSDSTLITTMAALAVCQAIEELTPVRPAIKWVNDLLVDGKKICGILTEAVSDWESGRVESVVVGVGLNFQSAFFPNELAGRVTSLFRPEDTPAVTPSRMAGEIYHRLITGCDLLGVPGEKDGFDSRRELLKQYKSRLSTLGQSVIFSQNGVERAGTALDIDENGRRVVQYASGETVRLAGGEITFAP